MTKPTDDELRNRFLYHKADAAATALHQWVSHVTLVLAQELRDRCPAGRNLSLALTALEDVRMRANAAIACDTLTEVMRSQSGKGD